MIYSKKAKLTFSLLKSATHVDTTVGYLVETTRLYRNYLLRLIGDTTGLALVPSPSRRGLG